MNRELHVGQTFGLPVPGVSDSAILPRPTVAGGLQRRPEPSGRTPDPRAGQTPGLPVSRTSGSAPSPLVAGLHSRGALPHLKREGASYFVTYRLAGTLPADVIRRLKREREAIVEQARMHNRPLTWQEAKQLCNWYAEKVDAYLDAGHGDCWLNQPEIAKLVAGAICFFERQRYTLHAWVVMPNHVHVVVHPTPPHTLSAILKSWKGYTAVQANRLLGRLGQTFWQSESYDHLCRDDEDRARCCTYTTMNPVQAGLCSRPQDWPWSSLWVGQTSGLPVCGVSDSAQAASAPDPAGLQRRPEPSGQRPDPQDVLGSPDPGHNPLLTHKQSP